MLHVVPVRISDKFVSVENLPRIPKDLISRIRAQKKPLNAIERQAIKICLNGGLPVHLLDSGLATDLKETDFEQVELYVGDYKKISGNILDKLATHIEDAKDHIDSKCSEAS